MPSSKTLERVVQAFRDGIPRRSANISTNGQILYSYDMPIAIRLESDDFRAIDRRDAPSATTTRHVNAVWDAIPSNRVHVISTQNLEQFIQEAS